MNTRETEDKYELEVYPRRDVVLARGKGAKLYDENGKEYIDCASNVGVSNIGHANDEVAKAIHEQYSRLGNCYGIFYNETRARCAKKLVDITHPNLTKVFFCNSGSEAIEAAIKFARASTGKKQIIAAMRAFHGKTMGSLAATWDPEYRNAFAPLLEGFVHVPFNDFEKLKAAVNENTAAIMLEIIQGEGGINIAGREFLSRVRQLCDEKNILLVIDEVQTGFGRTGKMFAYEHYDIAPDVLCLAKSIAGGIPMGAVVCCDKIKIQKKSHTTTFGGNPVACAAALASIDFMEKHNLPKKAQELGEYLIEKLKAIKSARIREVRGLGLMIAIELKEKAGPYVQKLMEKGIIVMLAGNTVIRLLPPLVISKEELDEAIEMIGEALQ